MPRQPRARRSAPRPSAQPDDTWQIGVINLRAWITEGDKPPIRPTAVVILGRPSNLVHLVDLAPAFAAPDLRDLVIRAIKKPSNAPPHQPARVVCADEALAVELAPLLAPLGIAVEPGPTPELDAAFASLESHLRKGEPLPPGFSDAPGVTPERLAQLFDATASFYRQAPWQVFADEHPVEVRFPAAGGTTFYAIAIGALGEQAGVAFYRSLDTLETARSGLPPEITTRLYDNEAILFGSITECAFSDLDAIERLGLAVAGDRAYSVPLILSRRGGLRPPTLADLDLYEAALRTVPAFLKEHLRPVLAGREPTEADEATEATIGTTVAGEPAEVFLRYPPRAEPRPPRRRRTRRRE